MTTSPSSFAVNTYSYIMSHRAEDCLAHLARQGYREFELMLYPGHLWPAELDTGGRQALRRFISAQKLRAVTLNMPNIDINIGAATAEMREFSLNLLDASVELAGDLGVPCVIIGPGKSNPLFPLQKTQMIPYLFAALDRLVPRAEKLGTGIALENLPIAFLPDADSMMAALDQYGDRRVGIVYDVANAVFYGEDPGMGLRRVHDRMCAIHLSDTSRQVYRHDPVGQGIVPFASIASVLREIRYAKPAILEIISAAPDASIRDSAEKLAALGWPVTP